MVEISEVLMKMTNNLFCLLPSIFIWGGGVLFWIHQILGHDYAILVNGHGHHMLTGQC